MLFPNEATTKQSGNDFERLSTAKFSDSSKRFKLLEIQTDYTKQFAHIYARRLDQMRPLLEAKSIEKWGMYNLLRLYK